jgi:type II secretory pathway pseudopilin PulG
LIVVTAILGIVALVAIPSFVSMSDGEAQLDLAASEVAAAIRFARSETIRTGTIHGARVVVALDCVRVFRLDVSNNRVLDVRHPIDKKLYEVSFDDSTFTSGVQVTSSDFRFGGGATPREAVGFDVSGSPLNDLNLKFLDSGQVVLSLGTETRIIAVAPVTGRVTIQ